MPRKSVIARSEKRKILFKKYNQKRIILRQELIKVNDFDEKLSIQAKLQKLPKNSSGTRIRRRCWKTGRSRGVFKHFGLCRHLLREMNNNGYLPGTIKASW